MTDERHYTAVAVIEAMSITAAEQQDRITQLETALRSLIDYADRHRVSHRDGKWCGCGPDRCFENWMTEKEHAERLAPREQP